MHLDLLARLTTFARLVSEKNLLDRVNTIWKSDRQFTYPAFEKTAKTTVQSLRRGGIEAEICPIAADGKTKYGDFVMPLAWDCTAATLEIVSAHGSKRRVIADRKDRPTHTVMWCGPTPREGITAHVVKILSVSDLKRKRREVRGKIVYTPHHPLQLKKALVDAGALAVVTSFCRNGQIIPDATFWFNAWSDNPEGWAFHAGDTPLPGMAISTNAGVELDSLLKRGPVTLKMVVRSRYFEGTLPVASGFLPGKSSEEILVIGHAMEQGANDNATGCAVILESLRAIRGGTRSGKLAPLRRGVRGVLTNECYGTMGYAAKNMESLRRTLAAVNWDTMGRHQESADAIFRYHRCADASASIADTLMRLLLDTWLPRAVPFSKVRMDLPFALTDNAYNDPDIGVPCVYVDSQDRFWHTSADTADTIHGPTLHAFAVISATYLHFLATATAPEMLWLADHTVRDYGKRLDDTSQFYAILLKDTRRKKPVTLARAFDHLDYVGEICAKSILSARAFMPREQRASAKAQLERLIAHIRRRVTLEKRRLGELAGCRPGKVPIPAAIKDIAHLRPRKKFIGTPAYEGLPDALVKKVGAPTWNSYVQCAGFWARGELTVAEIVRRVSFEFNRDTSLTIGRHFKFMAKQKLLEWV
jgi:hypothetical protein